MMTTPRSANPLDAVIGARLRVRRRAAGLSQQKLAERLGVTFQQIQKYERGANRIAASTLLAIAAALDTPASYFLGERGLGPSLEASGEATERGASELIQDYTSIKSTKVRAALVQLVHEVAWGDPDESIEA